MSKQTVGWVATISILVKHPEVDTQDAAYDYISETIRSLYGIEDWSYVAEGQPKQYDIKPDYAEGEAFGIDDPRPAEDVDDRCHACAFGEHNS